MITRRPLGTGPRIPTDTPEPRRARLAAEGTQTLPPDEPAVEQLRAAGRRTLGPGNGSS
ncbi:hypothetical protein [Streptomyces sp. NBC_00207]|uniref:hypothetical protein n=1 Tax=unclassified Streptomyces TaxID=2593676 RepID=UPI0028884668|nr:hypothetical protein [Streptomyces sp. DSM 41633]